MNRQIPVYRVVLGVLSVVFSPLYAPFSRSLANEKPPRMRWFFRLVSVLKGIRSGAGVRCRDSMPQ